MNILAVLPFASNASFPVWAATIVLATMTKTATKYFCIVYATDITGSFTKIGTVTGGGFGGP